MSEMNQTLLYEELKKQNEVIAFQDATIAELRAEVERLKGEKP